MMRSILATTAMSAFLAMTAAFPNTPAMSQEYPETDHQRPEALALCDDTRVFLNISLYAMTVQNRTFTLKIQDVWETFNPQLGCLSTAREVFRLLPFVPASESDAWKERQRELSAQEVESASTFEEARRAWAYTLHSSSEERDAELKMVELASTFEDARDAYFIVRFDPPRKDSAFSKMLKLASTDREVRFVLALLARNENTEQKNAAIRKLAEFYMMQ
jgi:hypothetical protein